MSVFIEPSRDKKIYLTYHIKQTKSNTNATAADTAETTLLTPPAVPSGLDARAMALHNRTLAGLTPGVQIVDLFNGEQPGNFGWLTWSGNPNVPTLIDNLTSPGNSDTYVNPNDPADHVVSPGDWVQGNPGVSNAKDVRDALDALLGVDIIMPVWDLTAGQGNNTNYHVTDFAQVRLTDY